MPGGHFDALMKAVRQFLDAIGDMTTEEFSRGGDRPAREALEAAYNRSLAESRTPATAVVDEEEAGDEQGG